MNPPFFQPPAYYPPPVARGGFARALFTTLAMTIFGISISLNIYFLLTSAALSGAAGGVRQTTIQPGAVDSSIAVIPIKGIITGATAESFEELLKAVEADATVKALVLEIDSPGGTVTGSDEIYRRVLRFKQEKNIPVVVSMGSLAASGGYYISCAADQIVAQPMTWTGSIGVLIQRVNVSKLAAQYGIEDVTTVATGTDYKYIGSILKPETPQTTEVFQGLVDEAMGVFSGVVKTGRKFDDKALALVTTGRVFTGVKAKELQLVDDLGYLDKAISIARVRAGLATTAAPRVVRFNKTPSLWAALSGGEASAPGSSSLVSAKIGSTELRFDRAALQEMLTPQAMYLWQGH